MKPTRNCAGCGNEYQHNSDSTLQNEYCLDCYRKYMKFRAPPRQKQTTKPCKFCGEPIEVKWGNRKYCNTKHRRWYYEYGPNPDMIKKQLCVVCGKVYNAPLHVATCSKSCARINQSEREWDSHYCKRCETYKDDKKRKLCDSCWEEFQQEQGWL